MEEKKKYIIIGGVVAVICLIVGLACYFYKINKEEGTETGAKSKVEEKLNIDEGQKLKDGITDSFYITISGAKHIIDVVYNLDDRENSNAFIVTLYYDNKKIESYKSTYVYPTGNASGSTAITREEASNFTIKDIKENSAKGVITKDDFKIIRGSNGKDYIAIYDYEFISDFKLSSSYLYVLDENGNLVTKLTDYDNFSLSNSEKTLDYNESNVRNSLLEGGRFTKIEGNNIYFYSSTLEGKMESNSITAYEYKLTLGDKLKFEKINTYNNLDIAGGGSSNESGLNNIVPNEVINNASKNEANTLTLKNGIADLLLLSVNGTNHRINITYLMNESNDGFNASVYYDNKKIDDYNSKYIFNSSTSKEEIEKYTRESLETKYSKGFITKDSFKIIKGSNGKEYVAIYSYQFNENFRLGSRILYILDENGNLVTKLVDYDGYSLSNSEKTLDYFNNESNNSLLEGGRFTKIEGNNIYFYSTTFEGMDKPSNMTAYEYKLTLGDTLKFEKINTYNNLDIAGGERKNTRNGLNTIAK